MAVEHASVNSDLHLPKLHLHRSSEISVQMTERKRLIGLPWDGENETLKVLISACQPAPALL
jgi:hypothetical protein